jgi:phage protein D
METAMSEYGRQAKLRILYNNNDITQDISPYILSCEYTDAIDKADDIALTVMNTDGRWIPSDGALLAVQYLIYETGSSVPIKLTCGVFAIDDVEASGPPDILSIRGTSAFVTTAIRREKKTRAWEKIKLSEIAQTIASKNGLTLVYQSNNNPTYARVDQKSKSDLEFLSELAEREGLRIKTIQRRLVVYSQEEYDKLGPASIVSKIGGKVISWRFTSSVTDTYSKVALKYRDAKTKKHIGYEYAPEDAPESGQTLRLNIQCGSIAEAERVAKNKLMAANRQTREASIEMAGDPLMVAGQNIQLLGFGERYDGNYAVEEARHAVWPYTTSVSLRQING